MSSGSSTWSRASGNQAPSAADCLSCTSVLHAANNDTIQGVTDPSGTEEQILPLLHRGLNRWPPVSVREQMPCLWHSLAGHVQAENISGTQYSKIKKPKTSTVRAFLCADSKGGCPPTLQGWTACSGQLSCLALACAACCAAHASIYRKDTAVWQALFCRLRRGHSHETLSLRRDEAPTPQRAEIAATIPDRPALACRRSCCVREVSALSARLRASPQLLPLAPTRDVPCRKNEEARELPGLPLYSGSKGGI